MSYPIAEETALGYLTHIFESCDKFQKWAQAHPDHGPIVSRALAGMSGRPIIGTVDHRLDKCEQTDAPTPVENTRLF